MDRRRRRAAGHGRRAAARPLRVRPVRPHRLRLQPDDAVRAVPAGAPHRPLAVRPVADGDPAQHACAPRRLGVPVNRAPDRGLYARRGLCRRGRRAARPDDGLRLARGARVPALGRRAAGADHRRRGLALWRHRRRHRLQDPAGRLSSSAPQYWMFWMGLFLVVLALVGRERLVAAAHARPAGARCGGDERRARNPRPRQALRRPRGHQRRHLPPRARRAPGADRAQRRGQDDLRQPADRRAAAVGRPGPAGRRGRHAAQARGAGAPRPGAHLPDQPAVRRPHAARDAGAGGRRAAGSRRATGAAGSARSMR